MLRIVIIDKTPEAISWLQKQLCAVFSDARVIAHTTNCGEGLRQIEDFHPDLVFLNITMMPEGYFAVLHRLQCPPYKLIYTAPDERFALRALKHNVYDYLLTPVTGADLEVLKQRLEADCMRKRPALFRAGQGAIRRLAIQTSPEEVLYEPSENIFHLQADSNYTRIKLSDQRVFVVSKTLKYFEGVLCPSGSMFMRVHQSHIINLQHISRFIRDEPGTIIMKDACAVPLSHARRSAFIQWLNAG